MGWWTGNARFVIFGLMLGLLTTTVTDSISSCDLGNEFACRSDPSLCIPLARIRDGSPDCPDRSDEECAGEEFQCQTIHQCIPNERFHDGWPDCDDGSDEECGRGQFKCRCGLPHCVYGHKVKDGVKDCDDGSDEVDQPQNTTVVCPEEDRLQDLMALERRRKKRQILQLHGSSDTDRKYNSSKEAKGYTPEFQKKIMKGSILKKNIHDPNLLKESFRTKRRVDFFLPLQQFDFLKEVKTPKIYNRHLKHINTLGEKKKFKDFLMKTSTETEIYGSLTSGKIYQTAINEPTSHLVMNSLKTSSGERLRFSGRNNFGMRYQRGMPEMETFTVSSISKTHELSPNSHDQFDTLLKSSKTVQRNDHESSISRHSVFSVGNFGKIENIANQTTLVFSESSIQKDKNKQKYSAPQTSAANNMEIHSLTGIEGFSRDSLRQGGGEKKVSRTFKTYRTVNAEENLSKKKKKQNISITFKKGIDLNESSYIPVNTKFSSRKLLSSVPATEEKLFRDETGKRKKFERLRRKYQILEKAREKRDISEASTSHIPLIFTPIVPYVLETSLHPTGVVLSVSGTDVIDGKTTEWTTVVKGTYISGTYAHIVHSTSYIFFTVSKTSLSNIPDNHMSTSIDNAILVTRTLDSSSSSLDTLVSVKSSTTEMETFESKDFHSPTDHLPLEPTSTLHAIKEVIEEPHSLSEKSEQMKYTKKLQEVFPIEEQKMDIHLGDKINKKIDQLVGNDSEIKVHSQNSFTDRETYTSTLLQGSNENEDENMTHTILTTDASAVEVISPYSNLLPENTTFTEVHSYFVPIQSSGDISSKTVDESLSSILPSFVEASSNVLSFSSSAIESEILSDNIPRMLFSGDYVVVAGVDNNFGEATSRIFTEIPTNETSESKDYEEEVKKKSINSKILPSLSSQFETNPHASTNKDNKDVNLQYGTSNIKTVIVSHPVENISSDTNSQIEYLETRQAHVGSDSTMSSISVVTSSTEFGGSTDIHKGDTSSVHHLDTALDKYNEEPIISNEKKLNSIFSVETDDPMRHEASKFNDETNIIIPFTENSMISEYIMNSKIPSGTLGLGKTEINTLYKTEDDETFLITPINLESSMRSAETTIDLNQSESSIREPATITMITSKPSTLGFQETILAEEKFIESVASQDIITSTTSEAVSESTIVNDAIGTLWIKSSKTDPLISETKPYETITFENDFSKKITNLLLPNGEPDENQNTQKPAEAYSEKQSKDDDTENLSTSNASERKRRDVNDKVTVLDPSLGVIVTGREDIFSPTTHYTTYTYYTTILNPGGGTRVTSHLQVDSSIVIPSAPYDLDNRETSCCDHGRRYVTPSGDYHVSRKPTNDAIIHNRQRTVLPVNPAVTHRTTYTYHTTRFRGGTSDINTRKVTETNVTPVPVLHDQSEVFRRQPSFYTAPPHYDDRFFLYSSMTQPDELTHRTTFTYYTTKLRGGSAVIETREETKINVTPIPTVRNVNPGVTRRRTGAGAYGTNDGILFTHRIEPHLNRPSDITHRTTFTYHTTRIRDGTPVVNTRKETITNVTPIPTFRPSTSIRRPSIVALNTGIPYNHGHRINTEPHNPREVTHSTTYTYHTTRLIRGTPYVETRKETEIHATPISRFNTFNENQRRTFTRPIDTSTIDVHHFNANTKPYETHRTTYTYYTTRVIAGTPVVETRKETETNLTPVPLGGRQTSRTPNRQINPYILPRNAADEVRNSECQTCRHPSDVSGRIRQQRPENNLATREIRRRINSHDAVGRITPSSTTHFSTYTYITTLLSNGQPQLRTRQHTVTEVLSDVVLPTARDGTSLTFGERIRQKRTLSVDSLGHSISGKLDIQESKSAQGNDFYLNDGELVPAPAGVFHVTSVPPRKMFAEGRRIRDSVPNTIHSTPEITPSSVTYYSTYTYFTTELKNGVPVVSSREHTVTEILTDVILPTVAQGRHIRNTLVPFNSHRGNRHLREIPKFRKKFQSTKNDTEAFSGRKSRSLLSLKVKRLVKDDDIGDPYASKASVRQRVLPTPTTHFTTFTYNKTVLKSRGGTSVQNSTNIVSSIYEQQLNQYIPQSEENYSVDTELTPYNSRTIPQVFFRTCNSNAECVLRNSDSRTHARETCRFCDPRYIEDRFQVLPSFLTKFSSNLLRPKRQNSYLTSIPINIMTGHPRKVYKVESEIISHSESEITPTHVTYYSTYTYFTTELKDGSSVVSSREHTVTEVLTDVIVPTVSHVGSRNAVHHSEIPRSYRHLRRIRSVYRDINNAPSHRRKEREMNIGLSEVRNALRASKDKIKVDLTDKATPFGKQSEIKTKGTGDKLNNLLGFSSRKEGNSGEEHENPIFSELLTHHYSIEPNSWLKTSIGEFEEMALEKVSSFSSIDTTPPLKHESQTFSFYGGIYIPETDIEISVYPTKATPLISSELELLSNTSVSLQPLRNYSLSKALGRSNRHDKHDKPDKPNIPAVYFKRRRKKRDNDMNKAYRPTFAANRRGSFHENPSAYGNPVARCVSCRIHGDHQHSSTRVYRNPGIGGSYVTRIPVKRKSHHIQGTLKRERNNLQSLNSEITPTHVTYFSTYTYFTTELKNGRSVISSREHTVTEILTDVIVPTIVPERIHTTRIKALAINEKSYRQVRDLANHVKGFENAKPVLRKLLTEESESEEMDIQETATKQSNYINIESLNSKASDEIPLVSTAPKLEQSHTASFQPDILPYSTLEVPKNEYDLTTLTTVLIPSINNIDSLGDFSADEKKASEITPHLSSLNDVGDPNSYRQISLMRSHLGDEDLYETDLLSADGAANIYSTVPNPVTHYTTYTYYTTILRPGGSKIIETNTKISSFVYNPAVHTQHNAYMDYNYKDKIKITGILPRRDTSTCCADTIRQRTPHQSRHIGQIRVPISYVTQRAVYPSQSRAQMSFTAQRNVYPSHGWAMTAYRPSFSKPVYNPAHGHQTEYSVDKNKCTTCVTSHIRTNSKINAHNRIRHSSASNTYVTSIPTHQILSRDHQLPKRRLEDPVNHHEAHVTPTRVTYFSTYTYFTTELKSGTPVVSSRKHTVTEILTDVIVPTVAAASSLNTVIQRLPQRSLRRTRGASEANEQNGILTFLNNDSTLNRRKLLSTDTQKEVEEIEILRNSRARADLDILNEITEPKGVPSVQKITNDFPKLRASKSKDELPNQSMGNKEEYIHGEYIHTPTLETLFSTQSPKNSMLAQRDAKKSQTIDNISSTENLKLFEIFHFLVHTNSGLKGDNRQETDSVKDTEIFYENRFPSTSLLSQHSISSPLRSENMTEIFFQSSIIPGKKKGILTQYSATSVVHDKNYPHDSVTETHSYVKKYKESKKYDDIRNLSLSTPRERREINKSEKIQTKKSFPSQLSELHRSTLDGSDPIFLNGIKLIEVFPDPVETLSITGSLDEGNSYSSKKVKNVALGDARSPVSETTVLKEIISSHSINSIIKSPEMTTKENFMEHSIPNEIFSNEQVRKAYSAYLEFVQSKPSISTSSVLARQISHSQSSYKKTTENNQTSKNTSPSFNSNVDVHIGTSHVEIVNFKPLFGEEKTSDIANFTAVNDKEAINPDQKGNTFTLTSESVRNGRITRYTTTIYGTHINGVYAQRAISESQIIPFASTPVPISLTFIRESNLPRMLGLVSNIVSKVTRGPVAVHITTEIYGTSIDGIYAQTARVYSSFQPVSGNSIKETLRMKTHSKSSVTSLGSRKTGLLSSRVLKTKEHEGITLLLVSEIYGTHIGGAYAHLGTFVTRTITPTTNDKASSTHESSEIPNVTKKLSSSYTFEGMKTGLITTSTRFYETNKTTTLHIYEVYGTFIDGTYAHVPSVVVKTISPSSTYDEHKYYTSNLVDKPLEVTMSSPNITNLNEFQSSELSTSEIKVEQNSAAFHKTFESLKIGLITTSLSDRIVNGSTIRHVYEVYGSVLDGTYAHVPSITVVTIQPTRVRETTDRFTVNHIETKSRLHPDIPLLLPKELRLPYVQDATNYKQRLKRSRTSEKKIFDLQSSFAEITRKDEMVHPETHSRTSPLPEIMSSKFPSRKITLPLPFGTELQSQNNDPSSLSEINLSRRKQNAIHEENLVKQYQNTKVLLLHAKKYLKRYKRSPARARTSYATNKRFGSSNEGKSSATNNFRRNYGSSTTLARASDTRKGSTRASFSHETSSPRETLKRPVNFLSRSQRNRAAPFSSSVNTPLSESHSRSNSAHSLPSKRNRELKRFSQTVDYRKPSSDRDNFEASEAVLRSVTQKGISRTRSSVPKKPAVSRTPKPLKSSNQRSVISPNRTRKPLLTTTSQAANRRTNRRQNTGQRNQKNEYMKEDIQSMISAASPTASTKRRFTLTTTSAWQPKLDPTATAWLSEKDQDDTNNLRDDDNVNSKRKSKSRSSSANSRERSTRRNKGTSSRSSSNYNDENELKFDKQKTLPLPPFGRARGLKRPPPFDPRTIKADSSTLTAAVITYTASSAIPDRIEEFSTEALNGPITVTAVVTSIKTLPVNLGLRTSFATITTTGFSTSVIPRNSLTTLTRGGHTKVLYSSIVHLPDASLPKEDQHTEVTEILLTTGEVESTSLVAIKVGYGTRTDTVVVKRIITSLTTQVNTIVDQNTQLPQQPFPYFQNPFPAPLLNRNEDYSLSISENSFVSTQTITSTTVLPIFFNGRTIHTTLTSTSITESTLVKTTTVKVPHAPSLPFVFPQPVFIMPSITTEITVYFTVRAGQILSVVTTVTVPLMPAQSHIRFARSVGDEIQPTASTSISNTHSVECSLYEGYSCSHFSGHEQGDSTFNTLQSSFLSSSDKSSTSLENDILTYETPLKHIPLNSPLKSSKRVILMNNDKSFERNKIRSYIEKIHDAPDDFHFINRKLLQDTNVIEPFRSLEDQFPGANFKSVPTGELTNSFFSNSPLQVITPSITDSFFLPDPAYNDDTFPRPIPSVRVIPTRRAFVRRIRPVIPADANLEGYGLRPNAQNIAYNAYNAPPPSYQFPGGTNSFGRNPAQIQNYAPHLNEEDRSIPNGNLNYGGRLTIPQNRRVIRLRRPSQAEAQGSDEEIAHEKPIVNTLPIEGHKPLRARGPVRISGTTAVRDFKDSNILYDRPNANRNNVVEIAPHNIAVPLTYYTTFTYMTTFLNGPSTAYSTREAVVSNIATETLNSAIVGMIRSKGGFTTPPYGIQTAVPLGSRSQGASTTIVNLASRIQVFNSDVYYSRPDESDSGEVRKPDGEFESNESSEEPRKTLFETVPVTDVATLPKTYYTLFTYYYTLFDDDKSSHSQRSETISNVVTETEPFLRHTFTNTINDKGYITLSPEKEIINLGSRISDGTTTEVNLELKTVIHFDGLKNVVLNTVGVMPSRVDYFVPTATDQDYNNYLEPGDPDVQDQQIYPQTVPIQPSFSSSEYSSTNQGHSFVDEATPEIPGNVQVIQTQPLRGILRIASTIVQRPGSLRSKVFAPRHGVRIRVRPATSRFTTESLESDDVPITETSKESLKQPETFELGNNTPALQDSVSRDFENDDSSDDTDGTDDEEDLSNYETSSEADEGSIEEENDNSSDTNSPSQRKRLKITVRKQLGQTTTKRNSRFVLPTRARPRFYVVTRTGSTGSSRVSNRPVSVKVSRRPRPSDAESSTDSRYKTYTTVTSVPVIFGLSTTYRSAIVTSSSLIEEPLLPSRTVVLTYFTTTTYTVPYTAAGLTTYTTIEETNSRVATETLDADADLSFITATVHPETIGETEHLSTAEAEDSRFFEDSTSSTVYEKVSTLGNQIGIGSRINLITKVSNGVSLIMASSTDNSPKEFTAHASKTITLQPTIVSDALLMKNKDITTFLEPRTFYTTFTFFTTFFSGGIPTISASEQVITNIYSVPVTQSVSPTSQIPVTLVETSENIVTATVFSTHTFFATLFNGTETFVTPLEEIQSDVISSTETFTITKTILPTPVLDIEMKTTQQERKEPLSTTIVTTAYRTLTNFVTLFRGTESIISPLEETVSDVVTITIDGTAEKESEIQSSKMSDSLVTKTVQETRVHYITLFSSGQAVLSSITEVTPNVITVLANSHTQNEVIITSAPESKIPVQSEKIEPSETLSPPILPTTESNEPTFQDLVPSVKTQYTTLTYFTTLFSDSSTILSSREEIATSYITLFVPIAVSEETKSLNDEYTLQNEKYKNNEAPTSSVISFHSISPSSEVLTFYTTYTHYTTLFRGTETIISDSETVVTQYVTIEATPTDSSPQVTTSFALNNRPLQSDIIEKKMSKNSISQSSPSEVILNIETVVSNPNDARDDTLTVVNTESNVETRSAVDDIDKQIDATVTVDSENKDRSVLTGTPTTDANGSTHILFTDFIVPTSSFSPSNSESTLNSKIFLKTPELSENIKKIEETLETTLKSIRQKSIFKTLTNSTQVQSPGSDGATTRLTDVDVTKNHMPLNPTTSHSSGSQTLGIKPGAVIDLSDVLGNTNFVGNLGETIKGIVNLFAANGNRGKNKTTGSVIASTTTTLISRDQSPSPPIGGVTVSNIEEPIYIPIGAIGRSTKESTKTTSSGVRLHPSTLITGFTPVLSDNNNEGISFSIREEKSQDTVGKISRTDILFGTDTIFIQPTSVSEISFRDNIVASISNENIRRNPAEEGSMSIHSEGDETSINSPIKDADGTSLITGYETLFFGIPDARNPLQPSTNIIDQGETSATSIVGVETIFFDPPSNDQKPSTLESRVISGATTIFGSFPALFSSRSTKNGEKETFTKTSVGDTTIFFPVHGAEDQNSPYPGTRYVTSVESVTLTLTLTTSTIYHTQETPVTVTSVFTTTIPPRTFVSTIIGSRTILGTLPEPTDAVQVVPTIQPSESTTTVTTTTLIFNSIATTVVRTLVIPTQAHSTTGDGDGTTTSTSTIISDISAVDSNSNQENQGSLPKLPLGRKPVKLFRAPNRPTEATTPRALNTGPILKLFPTKTTTTTTPQPPPRVTTQRKTTFRKPGKALVPITEGCVPECNLKQKEVCKQSEDKTWSCQCRPGFYKEEGLKECKDVKSYVVLVRVLKLDGNDVTYGEQLSNNLSPEYKNITSTARKMVDDAYKLSNVKEDYVSANVLGVSDGGRRKEGVLVNLTVHVKGGNPSNQELLREELVQSLDASASELALVNASQVSPIIQHVEDVQDFDECANDNYNDCSRSAVCANLPGSYTCNCKEGYQDLETTLPGRICSGEVKDCDFCNNRGVCIMTEDDKKFCKCYRMYLGKQCEINGLVLAIALPIALALLILTMFCLLCGCRRLRRQRSQKVKANVFKGMVPPMAGTLDRKAMILDSSSESSGEHGVRNIHAYDGFGDEFNSTMKRNKRSNSTDDQMSAEFQVPTVLIPRAKHQHSKQVNSNSRRVPQMDHW